jgi:hypothetical protein
MNSPGKRTSGVAMILVAGMLFLFALACGQSPTAPAAMEDGSAILTDYYPAKQDTVNPPPPPRPAR